MGCGLPALSEVGSEGSGDQLPRTVRLPPSIKRAAGKVATSNRLRASRVAPPDTILDEGERASAVVDGAGRREALAWVRVRG